MAIPGQDIYGWKRLDAQRAYQNARIKLARRRQDVLSQYGFTADIDPVTGRHSNVRVDPYAVGGAYQGMMRGHGQELDAAEAQSIERGLGAGAGLAAQAASTARERQGGEQANFARTLSGTMSDITQEDTDLEQGLQSQLSEIDMEAARQAIEDEAFTKAYAPIDDYADEPVQAPARMVQNQASARARAAVAASLKRRTAPPKPKKKRRR